MPRRALIRLILPLFPLIATACGGWTAPAPPAPSQPPQPAAIVRYRNEQEWIVSEIVGAMAGMAEYARTGKPGGANAEKLSVALVPRDPKAGPQPPRYTVQRDAGGPPLTVTVPHGIWWPADYAPAAAILFGAATGNAGAPRVAGTGATDIPYLTALLSPRAAVLIEADVRISKILARDMRSARAHEDAALLLGTLALREAAGTFDDVRSTLSRMTAHLACAELLRGSQPQSAEGFLAETILLTLAGHQAAAMANVRSVDAASSPEPLRAWLRALTLRITGDWRTLPNPHQATLLERFEYARALHDRVGTDRLLAFLDPAEKGDTIPDWQHIVLQRGFSVGMGNMFTGQPLALDLMEASEVWTAYHDMPSTGEPDGTTVMADLNDTPWPSPVYQANVRVIDWGRWAAFLQRHICAHLAARAKHHRALGKEAENQQFFEHLDDLFGKLTLYPVVLRNAAEDQPTYARAMASARTLATQHPERLTADAWYLLLEKPTAFVIPPTPFNSEATWFSGEAMLPGAPFELGRRVLRPQHTAPAEWIDRWKALRPYDSWVATAAEWARVDDAPTLDAAMRALGPLADYDIVALTRVYNFVPMTGEQSLAIARTLCATDVNYCDRLGLSLLRLRRDAEAVKAYERWIQGALDRVRVSNGVTWLVRYYLDTHQRARAGVVAAMAAEAASSVGIDTLAEVLDRQGNYDQAEALYQQIATLYDEHEMLGAFYQRMARRTRDVKYEMSAKRELKQAFAQGIEPIGPDALKAPPTDGITFPTQTARTLAAGMRDGDIIVAVDGTRVRNYWQYRIASRFGEAGDPRMELVVWRDDRYQTLRLNVPQRWFAVDMHDYAPPKSADARR